MYPSFHFHSSNFHKYQILLYSRVVELGDVIGSLLVRDLKKCRLVEKGRTSPGNKMPQSTEFGYKKKRRTGPSLDGIKKV